MLLAINDVPSEDEVAQAEQDEAAQTLAMEALHLAEPSLLARMWTWLRYGGWRWRHQ